MSRKQMKKRTVKELVCAKCDTMLDSDQLFCYECGEPSQVLKHNLSAMQTIKNVWNTYRENKGKNYLFVIFYFFALLVPLGAIIVFTHHNYYLHNLLLLVFLPFLFIPFSINVFGGKEAFTIKKYFSKIGDYPKYFGFILLNIVYFYLLKIITTSVDPILNLVRLVMVIYWLSIIIPLPHLLADKNFNFLKGWLSVYKGGKETRWQQFFLLVFAVVINIIGLALLGLGLLTTVPFTIALLESYYHEMSKHNLVEESISDED